MYASAPFSNTAIVFFKNAYFVVENDIIYVCTSLIRSDAELFVCFLAIGISSVWVAIYVFGPFFNPGNHLLFYWFVNTLDIWRLSHFFPQYMLQMDVPAHIKQFF